jgi:tRNA-modifying protein YgfZ
MNSARLTRYGLLSVTGEDARDFLHAQLTNDVLHLPQDRAVLAGWCSAKGRLLASFLVVPTANGFLLQLARDLAPAVAKRLSMFVLRSRVKIADVSDAWAQIGIWGEDFPGPVFSVRQDGARVKVKMDQQRTLLLGTDLQDFRAEGAEGAWTLEEIRAERPFITAATQDQFVPQMVNFEKLGGIDFQKGCYPGQEIVARAQYRGEVKRRMVRLPAPAGAELRPGSEFKGGVVIDAAGGELLAVLPV